MPRDIIRIPGRNEIEDVLKKASQFFLRKDKYLLKIKANERSLTHKLAEYIQEEIRNKEWGGIFGK